MIKLDLIELADLTRPSQITDEIIKQNSQLSFPVPLEEIASAVGISEIQKKPLDGLEGALVANPEKSAGIILVNSQSRHHRQRFTLGHELGHFMLPRHGHQMKCGIDDLKTSEKNTLSISQRIELEANQFSANLLMPQALFKKYPGYRGAPSMEQLIKQASDFDVSFEACAQRYVALHDEPVAIIFSHQQTVRYSCKNKDFPFWIHPGKGDSLPTDSFSTSAVSGISSTIASGNSQSTSWLNSDKYFHLPEEVIEELYIMDNGYSATLLYFDIELDEIE